MMKRVLFTAIVALMTTLAFSQNTILKVDKEVHDFGTIKEANGKVTTEFKITNAGLYPLVVSRVTASCGCTTPEWTKEPIAAGASGKVTVTYNPKNRPGSFTKTITVYANTEDGYVRVMIKGIVE